MLWIAAIPFLAAALSPALCRAAPRRAGLILSAAPLALTAYFAAQLGPTAAGGVSESVLAWAPSLDVELAFRLDGLSLLFSLLIAGIGTLVTLYTGAYLKGHPRLGRFYASLFLFMGAMLGTVLADNVFSLFVFWELTSVASFLLIGFESEKTKARAAALQALLVTGAGGLALLAGLILVGDAAGTYRISEIAARGDALQADPRFPLALALILAGAFTKSAQFPFHFWLPNAMAAPTPASAYLHSSTMVKAGLYLLARFYPALGDNAMWTYALIAAGSATMAVSAYMAFRQTYMKPMLAYTTLAALGAVTACLGIGGDAAIKGALTFLFAHALYKAALFLAAGILDHQTGEKNVERLGGLLRTMPVTAAATAAAALSLGGVAPFFGFIGKETALQAAIDAPLLPAIATAAMALAGAANAYVALMMGWRPFAGGHAGATESAGDPPAAMLAGPVLLGGLGILFGLAPGIAAAYVVAPAAAATACAPVAVKLPLWHGFNAALLISVGAVLTGAAAYALRGALRGAEPIGQALDRFGPGAAYDRLHDGLLAAARWQTRVLQHGYLRHYIAVILLFWLVVPGAALVWRTPLLTLGPEALPIGLYESGLAALIAAAAVYTLFAQRRIAAVASLGVVGYGVAMIFVLYGAPDVAMTQFVVETLTVLLFVLVFYRLPEFTRYSSRTVCVRDFALAAGAGGLMTLFGLAAMEMAPDTSVSAYYAENSVPLGHGRNPVNVILVDFRALDTLGEITVLAVSALGVYGLLAVGREKRRA